MAVVPKNIYKAFTVTYKGISDKLYTEIVISNGDKSIKGLGLWDTGATSSCISDDIASKLDLVPTGMMNIQTPSGSKPVNTFLVNAILPNQVSVADVRVCETDIGKQGIHMLIGMDIIRLGDFAVSNFNGRTVFTFRIPSKEKTDYVIQENISSKIGPKHGHGHKKRK